MNEQTDPPEQVEITESAKKEAKRMAKVYEDRPTAVLPGSDNTVTGTAINEWLDDDGNPKWGQDKGPDNGPENPEKTQPAG
ncbi:hypothetical protein [[Mycobacterium] burgundiense]|uniref:Antitoxin n=1 Tax=[Mycobacterium] burgundiense TaxID=3064286 RepID=A0ABM9LGP3_9MYCO|nr:hypothetical protein [Mycolicibacterium sp. MU0053]CAJ1498717.1 hypothetical protein MU0053_001228 [Mycolicibacterium sp. MU0053]